MIRPKKVKTSNGDVPQPTRYTFQSLLNSLETVQETTESPCSVTKLLPEIFQPLHFQFEMFCHDMQKMLTFPPMTTQIPIPDVHRSSCLPPIAVRWKRAKIVMQTMMPMATPMPLSMAVVMPDAKAYMVSSSKTGSP